MPNDVLTADLNGHATDDAVDPILAPLIERLDKISKEEQHVRQRLAGLADERRRLERGLGVLTGERGPGGGAKRGPRGPYKRVRDKPSGLSNERIEMFRKAILKISESQETFRQTDVRASGMVPGLSSGVTALAFKALRDENFIRLAKSEGQNKWFRLTREAANES